MRIDALTTLPPGGKLLISVNKDQAIKKAILRTGLQSYNVDIMIIKERIDT